MFQHKLHRRNLIYKFNFPKIISCRNLNKWFLLRLSYLLLVLTSACILLNFINIQIQQRWNFAINQNSQEETVNNSQSWPIFRRELYQNLQNSSAILLRVKGGTGNQLFQYACSYALARKLGWPLYIHISKDAINSPKFANPFATNTPKRPFSLDAFKIPIHSWNVVDDDWVSAREEQGSIMEIQDAQLLGSDIEYEGAKILQLSSIDYCQSEVFFSPYGSEIKDLFQLKEETSLQINHQYQDWTKLVQTSGENSIAVHIRLGDFLQLGRVVPLNFYRDGISLFLQKLNTSSTTFFIFSDQILSRRVKTLLENQLPSGHQLYFVEGLGPLQDLSLMTKCSHALIGNSSFAWWAAYLIKSTKKSSKRVIAASYDLSGIRSSYFRWQYKYLYYPVDWRKITVEYGKLEDQQDYL